MGRSRIEWAGFLALGMSACTGGGPETQAPQTPEDVSSSGSPAAATTGSITGPSKVSALSDASSREPTIKSLISDFDRIAANGTTTPEAQAFIDEYASPLTQTFVDAHNEISAETRLALINLLVSFEDQRTAPAHAKAIEHYANTAQSVDEAIWACQAAQRIKSQELASALLAAFEKIDASDKGGRRFARHLSAAMVHNATSSWSRIMIEKLAAGIKRPKSFNDSAAVKQFQNERFWQITATRVLGEVNDSRAARALLLARLDESKRSLHADADLSLLKLGSASVSVAESLLERSDDQLVAQSQAALPDATEPHVIHAARLLSALAHPTSRSSLETAWQQTNHRVSRALLALALSELPPAESSLKIWKQTYLTTGLKVTLPGGESALEALAETAPFWFDDSLVAWLGERVKSAPGAGSRKGDLRRMLILSIAKLVQAEQIPAANKLAQRYGGRTATPAFEAAASVVTQCGKQASCYVGQLGATTMSASKSAMMLAWVGKAADRDQLLKALSQQSDPAQGELFARVIEHLSAGDEAAVVAALETQLLAQKPVRAEALTPVAQLYFRLRARR